MRMLYKFFILILLLAGSQIISCSVFKKTTKSNSERLAEARKEAEKTQTSQKKLNRQTRIYSFWTDSTLFQFQTVDEQIDSKKAENASSNEAVSNRKISSNKESKPSDLLLYAVVGCVLFGCFALYRKFWPP